MQATDFEFRHRFWIISLVFCSAFACYYLDPENAGMALASGISRWSGLISAGAACRGVFALGAFLTVFAAWIRTWGTAYLDPGTVVSMRLQTSRLVADGPYRHVRNPLYLGTLLLGAGMGVMTSRLGFLVLVAALTFFLFRLILREEAALLSVQAEAYRAYCAAVSRLRPSVRPRIPKAGGRPDWKAGILGETFMWALAAAVVVFALAFDMVLFYRVLAGSFGLYGACLIMIRRRRKHPASR